jgi:hypothetical protein
MKLYNKKGKRNYKEVRLIKELEQELQKRIDKGEHSIVHNFQPADTFEELQSLHAQYTSTDVPFEEVKQTKETKLNADNMSTKDEPIIDKSDDLMDDDNSFIDPFNRQEPTTYDYTNDGGFSKESTPKNTGQTDFAEPMSFDEAFELPSEGDDDEPVENDAKGSNKKEKPEPRQSKSQNKKEDPWNPSFDGMSSGDQKKSTKKFAKYIVEAVCALAEKGFVWYANKDINDAKLTEYELNGEMNLSILVTLENGQDATVKRFFQQQCLAAEELAKFEDEEKKDMAEALAAVLLEKGIAPTATQELMIVVGGVLVKKGAILLSLKSQTNSLLNQLRAMNTTQPQYEPQPQPQYQPEPQPAQAQYQEPVVEDVPNMTFEQAGLVSDEDMLDIERVIETKE